MDKRIWYLGNGHYLEDDEAYKYIKKHNKEIIELYKTINKRLDEIKEYLEGYKVNVTEEYKDMYENVMEVGEICSTTAILLNNLADDIEERMEINE